MAAAREDFEAVLAARHYLYSLGQNLLGSQPSKETLASVDADLVRQAMEIVGYGPVLCEETGRTLAAATGRLDALKSSYTLLFVGPGKLSAAPWESVYVCRSRALFQRETLDVRNAYRTAGFLPEAYPRVADDHISLELGFMACLAGRSLQLFQKGEGWQVDLEMSLSFLESHMEKWVHAYARDLEKADGRLPRREMQGFYSVIACVLEKVPEGDERLIRALLNS